MEINEDVVKACYSVAEFDTTRKDYSILIKDKTIQITNKDDAFYYKEIPIVVGFDKEGKFGIQINKSKESQRKIYETAGKLIDDGEEIRHWIMKYIESLLQKEK